MVTSRARALGALLIVVAVSGVVVPAGIAGATAPSATLGALVGGFDDPAGMALDATGTLWVANNQAGSVQPVLEGTSEEAQLPAATTGLSYPADEAIDGSGLFVSEQGSTTVEELSIGEGATTQTFHGFQRPAEVAVDPGGNVWVANSGAGAGENTIREIPLGASASSTLPTAIGGFDRPNGIVSDADGNLWVANTGGSTIQEVPAGSTSVSTLPTPIGGFDNPYAIAIDADGNLWVTNMGNNTVQEVPAGATSSTVLPSPITGFEQPTDITIDPEGNLWVSNTGGDSIQEIPAGSTSSTVLQAAVGGFNGPFNIVFTSACQAWVSNVGEGFNGTGLTIQQISVPSGCASAPSDVVATPASGEAQVTWTEPSSAGSSAITGYEVTTVTGDGGCVTTGVTFTSCDVTGLENGTTYSFSVDALNGAGPSAYGSSPEVVIGPTPGAPADVTAAAGNASALVSWEPPTDHGGVVTGYAVTVHHGATLVATATATAAGSPERVSNLVNGWTYAFDVTASNSSGASAAGSASAMPSTVPGPVRSLAAVSSSSSVRLMWRPPLSDGGLALAGYDVYVGTKSGHESATPLNAKPLAPDAAAVVVTQLRAGVIYFFVVRAVNRRGVGSPSAQVHAKLA
jgi:streptogramin lyase